MTSSPEVSVVLSIYNEREVIGDCVAEVTHQMDRCGTSFELICVDDGSSDGTTEVLEGLAQSDPRVVPIHFSRNFGKEAALIAGLEVARGRAVLLMDADLQHPPSVIPLMLERWRQGYDVVDAVKTDRGEEHFLYRVMTRIFYGLLGRAVGRNLRGASDFKLLDRQVVEALLECGERNRFFRGLVAWVGFRVTQLPFEVQKRPAGKTKWSTSGLIAYSIQNIVAFSSVPLRIVGVMGFLTLGVALLVGVLMLYHYSQGIAVSGFTTLVLLLLSLCGLILLSLGVIAIYLAAMYDEQKARPLFVRWRTHSLKDGELKNP